jgi:hypothetical protein
VSDSGSAGEASSVLGPTNKDVTDSASGGDASSTTALLTANDSMVGTDASGLSTGFVPTIAGVDSFQHRSIPGNLSATAAYWYTAANNAGTPPNHGGGFVTFDTTEKRTASHLCSLKIQTDGVTTANLRRTIAATVVVGSVYFKVGTISGGQKLINCALSSGVAQVQLTSSGFISMKVGSGTAQTGNVNYNDGNWHRLDWKFDTSTGTATADCTVDGASTGCPQATLALASANMTTLVIGDNTVATSGCIFYYSDLVWSHTAADYPIGAHTCKMLAINGSGTHAQGSGAFQTMPGAGTTSYDTFVDDAWDGTTPELSQTGEDYVRQTVADGAGYLEFTVADPAGGDTVIWAASLGILMAAEDSATANNCEGRLVDSAGTTLATTGLVDPSVAATYYSGYRIATTVAPSGGWSNSSLAGVKIRWGFSTDVSPVPALNAAMVEYVVGA